MATPPCNSVWVEIQEQGFKDPQLALWVEGKIP